MRSKYRARIAGTLLACASVATILTTGANAAFAAPALDAYGELPGVENMAIAPDGHAIATVIQIKGKRSLMVLDTELKPLLNSETGDMKVRGLNWADNSTILVANSKTVALGMDFVAPKYELGGTIIIPMATRKAELVFSGSKAIADMTTATYGIRRIGGRTLGYFGGIAMDVTATGAHWRSGKTTLYAVDLSTNSARVVAQAAGDGHSRDWLIDADGRVCATIDIADTSGKWTITSARGLTLARGFAPTGDVSLISLGKDGTTLIYSVADENGDSDWREVPLAGGTDTPYLPGVAIDETYIDRHTGRLAGYRIKGDKPETVMFDPEQQSAVTRIFRAFGKRDVSLIDWTDDFSKVIVHTSGNADSGAWYYVDIAANKADPIGYDRLAIAPEDVGPISVVSYKAADGLAMDGILTLPPGVAARNLPVVILPHGGPTSHDTLSFDWWAQAFASRGYAVFQPNFRGSTNRDQAFIRAGYGEWGHKMQTDLSDGLAELAKQGIVDPRRACIVGASYGGYAALAGVTLQHGIYRCAVSVAGIADLGVMYRTDLVESGGSRMSGKSLRRQLGNPSGFDAISPRRFAATVEAPILLIHGKDDTVVPIKQSTIMADALKDAGKPYEMIVLPGEDHWLSSSETRKKMLQASVEFVLKNNPVN